MLVTHNTFCFEIRISVCFGAAVPSSGPCPTPRTAIHPLTHSLTPTTHTTLCSSIHPQLFARLFSFSPTQSVPASTGPHAPFLSHPRTPSHTQLPTHPSNPPPPTHPPINTHFQFHLNMMEPTDADCSHGPSKT
jgi:hypothetical protein